MPGLFKETTQLEAKPRSFPSEVSQGEGNPKLRYYTFYAHIYDLSSKLTSGYYF